MRVTYTTNQRKNKQKTGAHAACNSNANATNWGASLASFQLRNGGSNRTYCLDVTRSAACADGAGACCRQAARPTFAVLSLSEFFLLFFCV